MSASGFTVLQLRRTGAVRIDVASTGRMALSLLPDIGKVPAK